MGLEEAKKQLRINGRIVGMSLGSSVSAVPESDSRRQQIFLADSGGLQIA
jgi:hypothetical protein